MEILGTQPGQADVVRVLGNASLAGKLDLRIADDLQVSADTRFALMDIGGTLCGEFDAMAEATPVWSRPGGTLYVHYYHQSSGSSVVLNSSSVPVPEPTSLVAIAGFVAAGLLMNWRRRSRRRRAASKE
jgi:hypothetical protein